jgi:hypothetical protein
MNSGILKGGEELQQRIITKMNRYILQLDIITRIGVKNGSKSYNKNYNKIAVIIFCL